MSLSGNTTEERVWNFLYSKLGNKYGVAGLMGNIYAESGMIANRLEILCIKRLKEYYGKTYTDTSYTAEVDNGTISRERFLHPIEGKQYGYGFCQWTYPSRKAGLYDLAKSRGTSIGDEENQLIWLLTELQASYSSVYSTLQKAKSVREASDAVLKKFECPADTSEAMCQAREKYGKSYYNKHAQEISNTPTIYNTVTTADDKIKAVIDIATAEVGYCEKKSESNLYDKYTNAGSNNYTKYGKEMHALLPGVMDYPAAWCDCFVDWCFYKAFGAGPAKEVLCGNFDDYTVNSAGYYKNKGRWYTTPEKGDQIFFKNSGGICHTGIVTAVDRTYVYTIEGNSSNKVEQKKYYLTASSIAGYGRPHWDRIPGIVNKPETNATTQTTPSTSQSYMVKVTCDLLNIRTGAGTGYSKCGSITDRGCYTIVETRAGSDGYTWGKLKSGAGWIALDYTKRI